MPGLPSIGPLELIIVLAIALIILGPGKLPDVGAALGKTIREFRRAASDIDEAASLEPRPTKVTSGPLAPSVPAGAIDESQTPIAAAAREGSDPERAR